MPEMNPPNSPDEPQPAVIDEDSFPTESFPPVPTHPEGGLARGASRSHDGHVRASVAENLKQFVAAFNAHDLDGIMSYFSDDCVLETPRGTQAWGTRFEGRLAVREGLSQRFQGLPDVHYGDDEHWVCGDHAVSKWLLTGTTSTGEQVRVRGCDLFDLADDGRVQRKDSYWKIVVP